MSLIAVYGPTTNSPGMVNPALIRSYANPIMICTS